MAVAPPSWTTRRSPTRTSSHACFGSTVGGVNQAFTPTVRVADDGTVAVQHYDFRFDDPTSTPPLTTDVWLLRSGDGGASWTEERIGSGTPGVVTPGDGTGRSI